MAHATPITEADLQDELGCAGWIDGVRRLSDSDFKRLFGPLGHEKQLLNIIAIKQILNFKFRALICRLQDKERGGQEPFSPLSTKLRRSKAAQASLKASTIAHQETKALIIDLHKVIDALRVLSPKTLRVIDRAFEKPSFKQFPTLSFPPPTYWALLDESFPVFMCFIQCSDPTRAEIKKLPKLDRSTLKNCRKDFDKLVSSMINAPLAIEVGVNIALERASIHSRPLPGADRARGLCGAVDERLLGLLTVMETVHVEKKKGSDRVGLHSLISELADIYEALAGKPPRRNTKDIFTASHEQNIECGAFHDFAEIFINLAYEEAGKEHIAWPKIGWTVRRVLGRTQRLQD